MYIVIMKSDKISMMKDSKQNAYKIREVTKQAV